MFYANRATILHQDQHYLQIDRIELPLEPLQLGVPSSASKMVSQSMVHPTQTMHLSCTETNTISKQTKAILDDTHHLGVLSGACKLIFKHMVCSIQTLHPSYMKISTISKQILSSFHLSLFTYEYHRVLPQLFLSLWCIRRTPCTYLTLKLTLSPNRSK